MILDDILDKLSQKKIILLSPEKLEEILEHTKIIDEKNTIINGHIRIIKYGHHIFVQELTNKNELSLRKLNSLEEAKQFLNTRLNTYDKMWDGCGCKIDFYK